MDAGTAVVLMVNAPVVPPALTVTELGTVAAALLLESATVAALVGAALNVTVPWAAVPLTTLVGLTLTLVRVGVDGRCRCHDGVIAAAGDDDQRHRRRGDASRETAVLSERGYSWALLKMHDQ